VKRFILCRDEDVSGLSGVGHVAEGVEFYDGVCAMRWKTSIKTTTVYDSIADLIAIHSHEGKTTVKWLDAALP
jgi:hypothetical protein